MELKEKIAERERIIAWVDGNSYEGNQYWNSLLNPSRILNSKEWEAFKTELKKEELKWKQD